MGTSLNDLVTSTITMLALIEHMEYTLSFYHARYNNHLLNKEVASLTRGLEIAYNLFKSWVEFSEPGVSISVKSDTFPGAGAEEHTTSENELTLRYKLILYWDDGTTTECIYDNRQKAKYWGFHAYMTEWTFTGYEVVEIEPED